MSNSGDLRHFTATTTASSSYIAPSHHPIPTNTADPTIPLRNLTAVRTRIDAVRKFLSDSVNTRTLIGKQQMEFVSTEISSSIHQIIVNGAALIASSHSPTVPIPAQIPMPHTFNNPNPRPNRKFSEPDLTVELTEQNISDDWETIEFGSEELLAEYSHFCDICGKGFKRDANLRMHMRAHGNEFKTAEALANPDKFLNLGMKKIRFSCPSSGCNRNKSHDKFKPLKSVISVKNHFKRSHCPKMYVCNRCNNKSFSVMADLKNHLKHCGETKCRWKCSCGTSFSRKDKLFGHMALFEGHMPAIMDEDEKGNEAVDDDEVVMEEKELGMNVSGIGSFDGLIADYGSMEDFCLEDMFNTPNDSSLVVENEMDGFFEF